VETFSVLVLIAVSCNTDMENKIITEERKSNEGIRTVAYPKKFKNQKSYSKYLKALECVRQDDFDCAKDYLEQALSTDPDNSIIINDLGLTEMRLFNYDKASKLFRKAISLDSNYFTAYNNLGLNYYYDEQYDKAVNILKSVKIDSADYLDRRANYFHLFMNYTKLMNCDSAYHYYSLIKKSATNEIYLENVEEFKEIELIKNCPQQRI